MSVINVHRPRSVRIEACTNCQLKCKCCYMRNHDNAVGFGYLKYEDFVNFIEKNTYVEEVELSNSGEIFLNPDLVKIIKFAHEKDVALTAYNGVNLNNVSEEVLEALVKYNFNKMTCSIDGASQETYSQYRVGGDFDTVIANIRKINEYKKKYKSEYPNIKYQFIVFGHNEHEIVDAKKLAEELDVEINFKLSWDKSYSPIKNLQLVEKETGLKFEKNCDPTEKSKKNYFRNMCLRMWTQPQINWDGRLLGCCIQFQSDFGVNVFDIGLEEALKSANISYAKDMLMGLVEPKKGIICSTCSYYLAMKRNNAFVCEDEIKSFF